MSDRQPLDLFAAQLEPRVRASIRRGAKGTHEARTAEMQAAYGPRFETLRAEAARIKAQVVADLDGYRDAATRQLCAAGAHVHFAPSAAAAREIAQDVLRDVRAKRVVKSKSMLTEELGLNPALEAAGVRCVETDLGEFIVQIDEDRPSHIVKPILHKDRRQIAESFEREGLGAYDDDPETITRRARVHLRQAYLQADVGITGANFVSAESGRLVLVTNEGNARFSLAAPPVHIAFVGVEKLVPRDADLALFLELLARSGTGQPLTVYTQFLRGPRREGRSDGPRRMHVIFVDAGRRAIAKTEASEILHCIRCGACLNVCPVYRQAGGHGYRSVYPGPMGSVLMPLLGQPQESFLDLPKACSTCGACGEVCPSQIPLPDLLLRARDRGHREAKALAGRGTPDFTGFVALGTQPSMWRGALAAGHLTRAMPQWALRTSPSAGAWLEDRALPKWRGGALRSWLETRSGPRGADPALTSARARAPTTPSRPSPKTAPHRPLLPDDLPPRLGWTTFRERLEAVNGGLLEGVTGLGRILHNAGARTGYVDPALVTDALRAELEGFEITHRFSRDGIPDFAVTRATFAIAETGSVVLTDRDTPSRLSALAPWIHVAVVSQDDLLEDLPAAMAALGEDPSVIFVTGPSKTADVEGILIEGAHGPGVQLVCRVGPRRTSVDPLR